MLDPFEELANTVLLGPKDLDRFLSRWRDLEQRIRTACTEESLAAKLSPFAQSAWSTATLRKVQDWRAAYSGFRDRLPARLHLIYAQFDALSTRIHDAPDAARRSWARAWSSLRAGRPWAIRPVHLTWAALAEVTALAAFTRRLLASMEAN